MENLDKSSIEAVGNTDATKCVVVGNDVYDPLVFAPEIVRFSRREYLFLHHYRLGVALGEAAAKAGMTVDAVERFLARENTVKWLKDRAERDQVRLEWQEPAKWYAEGQKVWDGAKNASKAQIKVWEEFGKRVAPARRDSEGSVTKIEINIDPESIERSRARRKAIEAQIVEEQGGAA